MFSFMLVDFFRFFGFVGFVFVSLVRVCVFRCVMFVLFVSCFDRFFSFSLFFVSCSFHFGIFFCSSGTQTTNQLLASYLATLLSREGRRLPML